jgi:CubicO group peptidase (beta-lactamase class C family)
MSLIFIVAMLGHAFAFDTLQNCIDRLDGSLSGFSGTVTVSQNGQALFEKSLGVRKPGSTVRNDSNTYYDAGSIAKQFAGAAILHLAGAGRLDLNAPLSVFIPSLKDAAKKSITVLQLITHRSGLEDPGDDLYKTGDRAKNVANNLQNARFGGKPGAQMIYSNVGYEILAQIVEKASGETYESYLDVHLFGPAGIGCRHTGNASTPATKAAWGSLRGKATYQAGFNPAGILLAGESGITCRAKDLTKWTHALESEKLFTREELNMLWFLEGLNPSPAGRYAFGWEFDKTRRIVQHDGTDDGFIGWLFLNTEKHLALAVLSNKDERDQPKRLGENLKKIFREMGKPNPDCSKIGFR